MHAIFVMIKCDLGKTYEVADHIVDNVEQVSEVHSISGEYDLLAKFYLQEPADIGHFICEILQPTPGIRDTFTINTFNAFMA